MQEIEMLTEKELKILCELAEEVMEALCAAGERWNYMSLTGDKAFRQNVLPKLQELPIESVKSEYLSDFLPKARSALRKGTVNPDFTLPDKIPDSLLDEIFTLTWLGKVSRWASLREIVEGNNS